MLLALSNAEAIGWLCFVLGALVLLAGALKGFLIDRGATSEDAGSAKQKIEEAKTHLDDAKQHIERTTGEGVAAGGVEDAAAAAGDATDQAKSALEQAGAIISSLPENLRFSGVLVLIGTILIGVATIQFGGTSLF